MTLFRVRLKMILKIHNFFKKIAKQIGVFSIFDFCNLGFLKKNMNWLNYQCN